MVLKIENVFFMSVKCYYWETEDLEICSANWTLELQIKHVFYQILSSLFQSYIWNSVIVHLKYLKMMKGKKQYIILLLHTEVMYYFYEMIYIYKAKTEIHFYTLNAEIKMEHHRCWNNWYFLHEKKNLLGFCWISICHFPVSN